MKNFNDFFGKFISPAVTRLLFPSFHTVLSPTLHVQIGIIPLKPLAFRLFRKVVGLIMQIIYQRLWFIGLVFQAGSPGRKTTGDGLFKAPVETVVNLIKIISH